MSEPKYFAGELKIPEKKEEKADYVKSFGEGALYGALWTHLNATCNVKMHGIMEKKFAGERWAAFGGLIAGLSTTLFPIINFYVDKYYDNNHSWILAIPVVTNIASLSHELVKAVRPSKTIDSLVES